MKRGILRHKFALWLITALALVSCSQDELTEQGTPLPDGMYPMTFTAVQAMPGSTPQTRVSESANGVSSQWDGGEVIKVTVSGTGNDMKTDCTLDGSGNITAYNPQLYWQNTNNATINAWYSNIEGQSTGAENTVSLTDQSEGLAYVLKVEESVPANYKTEDIALKFSHQLAKIRVKLENDSYLGDLSNATVKVKGHTSCTVKNGEVSEGSGEGYITMHKNGDWYEANLVPGTLKASEAFEISVGNKNTKANLQNGVVLEKGQVHMVTITVKQKVTEVDLSKLKSTYTIDQDGVYIFTGSTTQRIVINANVTVTLKGVTIKTSSGGAPIQISGSHTATLILENENNLTAPQYYSAILPDQGSTIEIDGEGKLTAKGGEHGAGIGASNNTDTSYDGRMRNHAGCVKISGGEINAIGGYAATGIGCSYYANCQGIEISGGIVTAKAGTAYTIPAIGHSENLTGRCEYVKLSECTIYAYSRFSDQTDPVVAKSVTPDVNDPAALVDAKVTLEEYETDQ